MSKHTYNAPLSIAKTGRELHVLIAGDLKLFTTTDKLRVTVEQIVNSYNACAGMENPEQEIQRMRDTIKGYEDVLHEISQQKSCRHSELQKGLTCLELKSEQLDTYCAYCLAAHTLKKL